ncbi:MAG TPA: hypothetical protein DDZ51_08605 [Planctomycetaceae bacterium]|nr:hypothetical protein [Planctomycetaceae bacterium]
MSLTHGNGANTSRLIIHHGWSSLLLDGGTGNPEINLHSHFLTSANICSIFQQYNVPSEPEYISIDVDSVDLWLFRAVLSKYRAMVFSVEYNCHFPLDAAVTFPDNPDEHWEGDRGYGASLRALTLVAEEHGYCLLWVVPKVDAFFIRKDLIDDGTDKIVFPFGRWRTATNRQIHPPLKNPERAGLFINYERTQLGSSNDVPSRSTAYDTATTYLVNNGDFETQLNKFRRLPANVVRRLKRLF